MFCTRVVLVCLVCLLLCKEEGSSLVSGVWDMYDVPLSMSLLGFGMLVNLCWYKSSFQDAREECESKRASVI